MRLRTLSLFALCLNTSIPLATAQEIPKRPEDIQFAALDFEPPEAAGYRHELTNGVLVYLAPSRELPLVNIVFTFKGGGYLDPMGQVGLVSATGSMIRRGGTMYVSAEEVDERFDFLAANVTSSSGSTTSRISNINSFCVYYKSNCNKSFSRKCTKISSLNSKKFNGFR